MERLLFLLVVRHGDFFDNLSFLVSGYFLLSYLPAISLVPRVSFGSGSLSSELVCKPMFHESCDIRPFRTLVQRTSNERPVSQSRTDVGHR